jgi:cell shape-determining protein MreC
MIFTILSQGVLSLIIIIVMHYLYTFFKDNLTTPKIKDLVTKPSEEYKKIYSTIQNSQSSYTNDINEKEKRKNELKKYMKSLTEKKNISLNEKQSQDQSLQQEEQLQQNNNNILSFDLDNNLSNFSAF